MRVVKPINERARGSDVGASLYNVNPKLPFYLEEIFLRIIIITGSTSAPILTAMSTLTSFILTPQAPVDNPQCVTDYNIIPAGTDSVVREDIPVAIEDLGIEILVDGYDVCLYTYNFTIFATTLTGELWTTVSQDNPIDLSGTHFRKV